MPKRSHGYRGLVAFEYRLNVGEPAFKAGNNYPDVLLSEWWRENAERYTRNHAGSERRRAYYSIQHSYRGIDHYLRHHRVDGVAYFHIIGIQFAAFDFPCSSFKATHKLSGPRQSGFSNMIHGSAKG